MTVSYETLRVEAGAVSVITLNRPQVHNALSNQLRKELGLALDGMRRDDEVRAVILTGAGERAFSAGLDIRELSGAQASISPADKWRFRWSQPHPLAVFDKPVIAAVNGLAIGGGVELTLLCDIVLAADHATFAFAEVKRGIMPGNGGTQRLSRRVGKGRALDMILTGRTVGAQEAASIGLVDSVIPDDRLLAEALQIGHAIASNAPIAVRMARDAIHRGFEMPLDDALRLEGDLAAFLYTTDDAREGPRAFLEKRLPEWKGR